MTSSTRALWLFTLASFATVALGALVMQQGGVPLGIWIRNPIAWAVATLLALLLVRRIRLGVWMTPIALIVIALSFLGPAQEGVHRWLGLGPIQLNAAALVLPAAIGAFAYERPTLGFACLALIAAALAWQPDISQLAGFAPAAAALALWRLRWPAALAAAVICAAAIALCLTRPDPLAPVEHVEGIVFMAWAQSPALAIAMTGSLALASLSPLLLWPVHELRWKARALAAYFVLTGAAWVFGAYPVPLAGYGLSFVLGWPLGLAALAASSGLRR